MTSCPYVVLQKRMNISGMTYVLQGEQYLGSGHGTREAIYWRIEQETEKDEERGKESEHD